MGRSSGVAQLLRRTFTVLIGLILLTGAAGVAGSALQYRSVRELTDHVLPMRVANVQTRAVLADAQRALRGYHLTGDRDYLTGYQNAQRDFAAVAATLREMAEDAEAAAVVEQVRRADDWWALAERQRILPPGSPRAAEFVEQGKALFERFRASNADLDASLAQRAEALRAAAGHLRTATYLAAALVIASAALVGAVRAIRVTRQITGPLDEVTGVLARLGDGDFAARAPTDQAPHELRVLAAAVNAHADTSDRIRAEEAAERDLGQAARRLGVAIRGHLSVDAALAEAAQGMGRLFGADHVVVRLRGVAGGPAGTAAWSAPEAPGDPGVLTRHPLDWLDGTLTDGPILLDQPGGPALPEGETLALVAAGAGAVAVLPVATGSTLIGCLVLIRRAGQQPWTLRQALIAEHVAGDLARGVEQAGLYERERRLVTELQDVDRMKSDLLSTVTHELRTPLTSIAGYAEMLRDEDVDTLTPAQAGMVDAINRNARRLRLLIEDLLTLSRVEDGAFHSIRDAVEVGALIDAARHEVEPAAGAAGLALDVDVAGRLDIAGDAEQIGRLLHNLLSNAVKFTPPGGRVTVTARRADDEIMITVADTGIGIPAQERSRVFGRFFRASNAVRNEIPGTGLGLAIAHAIVHGHDGELTLSTAEGAGTRVVVRLPAAPVPAPVPAVLDARAR